MRTIKDVEKLFQFAHLPKHLQDVSYPFHKLATTLFTELPPSAELTLALRKLWEAKNLAVWCAANKEDE
jgi:hypothetical protein